MEPTTDISAEQYFKERLEQLGITEEWNQIVIKQTDPKDPQKEIELPQPIFRKHDKGIEIMVYGLDRLFINYTPENSRWKKRWSIVRLFKPLPNGTKYLMPKGNGSFPFFPPKLVEKYEASTPIETLFLTEGYFKAFKAGMCGIDCIGLPSITHMKDRATGAIHQGIADVIERCKVQKLVWLTDGDCLDIAHTLVDEGGKPKDLSARPFNFFNSIQTFQQLLDSNKNVNKYFMHVNSDDIEGKPKGLDDLLCALPDQVENIVADINNVSKPGMYFTKFNITFGLGKVYSYFHIDSVDRFYMYHVEKRPELKDKQFKYRGTLYQWNEKDAKCDVVVPGDASKFFRVGDNYFKFVNIPNQHKQLERVFMERKKGTIMDDFGKDFLRHVAKFEAFCNVPDHTSFHQVIHNCFNVYSPLEFQPDEEDCTPEDCPTIVSFIKHIFGESTAKCSINGEPFQVSNFEMGMDYVQLLYQQPQEKLPVLCLVSKENATGKSTFGNLLRLMLASNVAIVGNQDLSADFNAHWATKLVVVCDETKIDKQNVVEKVKMLSTAKKVMMNAKGRNQVEIDCFIKFILVTNNEENFIYASDEDIRFWVVKVPKLKTENPNIMENFVEEMPAFMSYLNRRKLSTTKQGRMWFKPDLLKTEALKKVIAYSQPVVEKELRNYLRDMFLDFGLDTIMMTRKAIHKEVFNNKYESNYLEKILKDNLKVEQYHMFDHAQVDEEGKPKKIYKTTRYSYPKWEEKHDGGKREMVWVNIYDNGRPYVFKRDQFLTPDEIATNIIDQATQNINNMEPDIVGVGGLDPAEDLPF